MTPLGYRTLMTDHTARTDGRLLGATKLPVSPLGLGLAALGRPEYINLARDADLGADRSVREMERRAHDVLDEAWRLGVRYVDTARSYGRAEAFLGAWLISRRIDPRDVVVGSKWGYTYTANWQVDAETHEIKDHDLATFERQLPESRAHLGEHLDLYQVHSLTLESGALDRPRLLESLARLKGAGTPIGFSTSGPDGAHTIERALGVCVDGVRLFDAVQATWNPLEPSATRALEAAHADGVGVILKETLANGRLSKHGASTLAPATETRLRQQAARLSTTLDGFALAAALARPWADVVLSGAATVSHVASNVAALSVAWDDEAERALVASAEGASEYWQRRAELPWS